MNKLPIELGAKGCQVLMMMELNKGIGQRELGRVLGMSRGEVREAIKRINNNPLYNPTYNPLYNPPNELKDSKLGDANNPTYNPLYNPTYNPLSDEELENRVNELKISELDVEDERKVVESPGPPPPSLLTTSLLPPIIPLVDDNKENTLISKDIVQKKGSKPKYGSDLTGMDEEEREYIATMKKRFPFIMRMDQPLTLTEFRKLKQNWSPQHITNTIESLNNFKGITKYRSAYKTLLNWCKNG